MTAQHDDIAQPGGHDDDRPQRRPAPAPRAGRAAAGGEGSAVPAVQGAGDEPVDVAKAVTEMKRLLDQIEQAEQSGASGNSMQAMARILQYVHDSHGRIVKTLENQDRSELFLQSTNALNQTFRKLNQSQDALVDKLLAERRRNPWWIALGSALTGVLVIVAVFLLIDYRNDGLRHEVDRMAVARDGLTGAFSDSQKAFQEMGTQLGSTVEKVLAANRVLDNENKTKNAEIERLKQQLGSSTAQAESIAAERQQRETRLEEAQAEAKKLASESERLRERLLDKELQVDKLTKLIEKVPQLPAATDPSSLANAPSADAGNPSSPVASSETPATAGAGAASDPGAAAATAPHVEAIPDGSEQPPEAPLDGNEPDPSASVIVPTVDPIVSEFNEMLNNAGVLDHRLLRHGGVKDGVLADVVLELRSLEGLPIGFRSARALKFIVDPAALSARLHLTEGESVERGERTPFPPDGYDVTIAAVTRESLALPALNPFLELSAPAPVAPIAKPRPPFDSRVPLAILNQALERAGRGHLRFTALRGVDEGMLREVELQHYSGSGSLLKTVIASSCTFEIDAPARRVGLVFRDGHHVTNGREVPFFKGRRDAAGEATWRLDLDDVDPEQWVMLKERLAAVRSENGDPAVSDSSP